MLFLLTDLPKILKFGKARGNLITLFYVSLFPSAKKDLLSSLKNQNNNYSSTSDSGKYTKFRLIKNARTFPKNFIIQENIKISRLKKENINKPLQ